MFSFGIEPKLNTKLLHVYWDAEFACVNCVYRDGFQLSFRPIGKEGILMSVGRDPRLRLYLQGPIDVAPLQK